MSKKVGSTKRKQSLRTFYLTPEMVAALRRYSEEWGCSQSAAARFIISRGLKSVEKKPPKIETVSKAVL